MRHTIALLMALVLAGCQDPHATDLGDITHFEWAPNQQQEEVGRVIVMVARGWSDWPDSYTFEGHTRPFTIDMGMMKPGTQYRVTVQEMRP